MGVVSSCCSVACHVGNDNTAPMYFVGVIASYLLIRIFKVKQNDVYSYKAQMKTDCTDYFY